MSAITCHVDSPRREHQLVYACFERRAERSTGQGQARARRARRGRRVIDLMHPDTRRTPGTPSNFSSPADETGEARGVRQGNSGAQQIRQKKCWTSRELNFTGLFQTRNKMFRTTVLYRTATSFFFCLWFSYLTSFAFFFIAFESSFLEWEYILWYFHTSRECTSFMLIKGRKNVQVGATGVPFLANFHRSN